MKPPLLLLCAQGGNVYEWNESILSPEGNPQRGVRGGSFGQFSGAMAASNQASYGPLSTDDFIFPEHIGFRVARLPEPGAPLLLACGLVGLGVGRRLA